MTDEKSIDSNGVILWLAEHCRATPLDEKWLLVEHLRVGQQWKDRLTRSGCWHINLHAKTFRLVVNDLASAWLAQNELAPIGRDGLELLVDRVVHQLLAAGRLTYFTIHESARHALTKLLVRSYHDWRLAGLSLEALREDALEVPEKAADLKTIFSQVRDQLAASGQVDYADCICGVIAAIKNHTLALPARLNILQPESFPITKLERDLLTLLKGHGCAHSEFVPAATEARSGTSTIDMHRFAAVGEINEVRGVFQHAFAFSDHPAPLDNIEILVTDYELYAPLVLEGMWQWSASTGAEDKKDYGLPSLPITFAEGIACIYSRPGRLLRSWIRWLESDCLQSKAVQLLREGLLKRPSDAEQVGYARLAGTLRRLSIGFGLARYLPQLQSALDAAGRDAQNSAAREGDRQNRGDHGVSTLVALLSTIRPIIESAPPATASSMEILQSARALLAGHARAESTIDRYARAKLLEDIDGMQSMLEGTSNTFVNVRAWLEELPTRSRLLASTPSPGAVHVAPVEQGGASGRPCVFVLGMDDRRFPRRKSLDAILLDEERKRISVELPTSEDASRHEQTMLDRVLMRLTGIPDARIIFSYSLRNLIDDSECFPSPQFNRLPIKQLTNGAVAFIADEAQTSLTESELTTRRLLLEPSAQQRQLRLMQLFPRIAQQRHALECQSAEQYGPYDGWVPSAGHDLLLSATTRPMSASRLETLGTCPRKHFFSRALDVSPPTDCKIDPDRWLTAMDVGSFLHRLFEEFLSELQARDETPDPARHAARLQEMLASKIASELERVPVHNAEAYRRQCDELAAACEIFLQKEHEYSTLRGAKTWIMEASLGNLQHSQSHSATQLDTDQPITIDLANGRTLHLCGRIDRIDRIGCHNASDKDSQAEYLIWDYKTGSAWGYDPADPIRQGRKLQPLLYVRMLAARLAQLGQNPESVKGFGYFFPSPHAEGLRYEWSRAELASGNETLEAMLDLLAAGTFIATNDKNDCGYCDYQRVCGSAEQLVAISNLKTESVENVQLAAWRRMRAKTGQKVE